MTTNKVAVVTGGSHGIGAAIAKKLAARGAAVAVVYRGNEAEALSVVGAITGAGGVAAAFAADVANQTAVQSAIEAIVAAATPEARRQAVIAATPAGRIGEPADIADVVVFLMSDDSRWITGRTILTDGGLTDAL
ncbi:NAD(P)-dependent dehydrogenase (short-subunit alcohol dehydrogenase family) [Pararhizobium capsulatum DSM 1112]|uniref:NAD(P)-dependent dehydrogenase (Short-subunit alcohol dehydrogenase family) n=1 Tax=Pararhizobium capsulatum DSM 1112 TaxID=1121113 RepID=A0ABU0BZ02_9HYPH|nr:SDR family oxidoreductase [Pararhizobium capsulatum]MDQ0322929.1 NAD(P)-dependent dehydrogenase (short-subunit alcohol dehydrogenase family) [Pararhizobium capsulatum DSM 1112]